MHQQLRLQHAAHRIIADANCDYDQGRTQEPDWKPLFDSYVPVKDWLKEIKPDVAIVVYNDHGGDFFFDKYPTFAVGAAATYPVGDEGWGRRPLPDFPGDTEFSWHLCNELVYNECSNLQKLSLERSNPEIQ